MSQANPQKSAQDLYKDAQELIKQQQFEQALEVLDQSLAVEETPEALHDKGVICYMHGDLDAAAKCLQAATLLKPDYDQAYSNLTRIMYEKDEPAMALEYGILAMQAAPENVRYKDNFMQILRGMDFQIFVPELKPQIAFCLKAEHIDHESVARAWLSLLQRDPDYKKFYKLDKHTDFVKFEKEFFGLKVDALLDEYLLLGLRRLVVADLTFERIMTNIRHALLDKGDEKYLPLASALAEYCFQTEYIFNFTAEEEQAVAALKAEVEGGAVSDPFKIAMLGCYMPLCRLSNAKLVADTVQGIDDLVIRQILEPLEEEKYKKSIESVTGIDDETSQAVRAQYEEFPYPRWRTIGFDYMPRVNFEEEIKTILIAGSGTGKEALGIARTFPQADILAVDISLTSLAYSIRMARELKVSNVTFKHGDILGLGVLDRKFDLITSSGVLHHMNNPIAGWTVLMGLMKPRGYMHIGLYSRTARQFINQARKIISEQGYSNTGEDIRRFRRDCVDKFDPLLLRNLLGFRDFFSLSDCRDLLFHVMEHQFDLADIQKQMEEFGLEPLHFVMPEPLEKIYHQEHPDDPNNKDIPAMIEFEKDHPKTFAGMYDFWSRKT